MNSLNYLQKDHQEIFGTLLDLEEIIDNENLNLLELTYVFHKLNHLILQHNQNEKFIFEEINENSGIKIPINKIFLDPRRVKGHIRVIDEAIQFRDTDRIKIALDNDGRMFISRIKEQIFKEEKIFDRIRFFHLIH